MSTGTYAGGSYAGQADSMRAPKIAIDDEELASEFSVSRLGLAQSLKHADFRACEVTTSGGAVLNRIWWPRPEHHFKSRRLP